MSKEYRVLKRFVLPPDRDRARRRNHVWVEQGEIVSLDRSDREMPEIKALIRKRHLEPVESEQTSSSSIISEVEKQKSHYPPRNPRTGKHGSDSEAAACSVCSPDRSQPDLPSKDGE